MTPVKHRLRPLNPKQRKSLRAQMDLWLKEGVIEESNSPWGSALVPAFKKGDTGDNIRWAVDYRNLNSQTVSDSFPIPSIEENLEKLQGSSCFSAIDASAAYHVIKVGEKSKPYLAFLTPWGTYTFKKMPFGAKNAGSTYSRLVELSIIKLRSPNVLAYLDNIIVATQRKKGLMDHVRELENVLSMHREAGIKIRAEKTHLMRKEVDYLGYRVTEEGIKMKESYVEKITQWPTPRTVKELATFIGFTSYYRSFIPEYSYLTNEMNTMKKETKLTWNENLEEKFKKLKEAFSKAPIRSYPDYSSEEPFELATDFSADNVAVILSQQQNGKERFIAAAGRKTTRYERNYHSAKGELSAIIYGLRKFEHILRYKKLIIHTDSAALTYLQTMKKLTGIYFRWLSELQSFEFQIKHRPGKKNLNADALSRSKHLREPTKEEEDEQAEYIHSLHELGRKLTRENIIKEQKADETLKKVRKWIRNNRKPDKREIASENNIVKTYYQKYEALTMTNGILYNKIRCNTTEKMKHRICVPKRLIEASWTWSHSHPHAGHFGINATLQRLQTRFYYPSMKHDSETRVRACADCLAKIQKAKIRDATHHPRRNGYPGEQLFVDLVGPMPVTRNGEKYILTIEDSFTRYAMAVPIPNKEAATITKHLMERYVSIFGTPSAIHFDRGTEFTAEVFRDLMDKLQAARTVTPAYNPQSNGNLERFHRTLNSILRVFCDREDTEWSQYLPAATLAYNTKEHSATGVTPFSGMFGRQCRLPIDLIIPTPDEKHKNINVVVRETLDRFKKMFYQMRQKNDATFRRNAQLYTGKTNDIQVGTRVWYLAPRKVKQKKTGITDQWVGPYKVIKKISEVLIDIKPADYHGPTITCHMSHVSGHSSQGCYGNH